ncbi:GNAT family N-acetyltransferase [Cryobacterium sp. MLB-32]|uniref:GNAT family N-acetyltransferase n=1 Tax=Cryobacterium sp. MLB-32 TaxID=1529318 RepID=UPI0009E02F89
MRSGMVAAAAASAWVVMRKGRGWQATRSAAGGLGRKMMTAAEHWLREQGAVKVQLMIRSTNDAVLGFYNHIGYEDADVQVRSKWLA